MGIPIDDVVVNLESEKDTFNLLGKVSMNIGSSRGIDEANVRRAIAQRFLQNNPTKEIEEKGRSFVVIASRGTKFVLDQQFSRNIIISTGLIQKDSDMGKSDFFQFIPAPSSTKESFDAVMDDFVEVFKVAVEESYKASQKVSPNEELILRPPKVGASKANGIESLFGIQAPEDILNKIKIETPDVKFEDIGGQAEAKREIQGLAFALKNPALYKKWGTKPPKGIILHGPPGTGKTLMAKALASQADARFFHVKASDIASKWYGESEKIVKDIFELASEDEGNTIIFFDEIDAIAPKRKGSHEATHRTLSTLLEHMDGMAPHDNVMVVASTNMLDDIDPALLRAGRFDRSVEVPLPDEEGRKQIFNIHMAIAEKIAGRKLFRDLDMDKLAQKTDKFSGADIAEIIRRTLEEKVRLEGTMNFEPNLVETENIITELILYEKKKPS